MLLFRSEAHVDRWCTIENVARGDILTLEQLWLLAKLWYHNRLDLDYAGRTVDESHAIFEQVGLVSAFWRMTAD